ncbi:MAG: hypothetical protein A2X13_11595 [Bacteroidetes bacterium GWC2_33_15]|nr:MAG: hypothetical protein A2X10_05620 [Bacteroidetes bacterium GWA2_33_15]OFX50781.1 MAG: hypothetical protein A2X13_11595 [Bacteroidetes bacterium GWC2_33_15]OFX62936.1 MAG: hypothetical protein A2X15_09775 [Bacteroidetes bacterium GWB2_32_14]OFX70006.1 MAG: hypothetical protein A2X14_02635 [Bacteroidetes bacterium GWD2_33_33]HAN19002.1 hypothetical protein [Bacteroidales bacterium]
MYTYDDIAFRVIERDDLNALRLLHNDLSIWGNLLNIEFIDEKDQENWWENLYRKKNDKRYVICQKDTPNKIIGRLRIQNINWQHHNCEVGLDIISEFRGKGYGYKSYKMLLEFLFDHYNMNMLYLKVADFNPKAKKLYEKVGFKETGKLPDFFYRKGKYWDYIIMSITKFEYQNLK